VEIEKFEDVIAWQKGRCLTLLVYGTFKSLRDFAFRDQIQRAVISICNNIAEGFERRSNKELRQFLYISKGSCGEIRSMLHIALSLGYINKIQFSEMYNLSYEISRILGDFISDVERVRPDSNRNERAEELIQVQYFGVLLRGTFIKSL
jgi:four helix bundle protein